MSCDNVHDRISSFLDGQVPAGERERLSAHIKSCRECGAYLESAQELRAALREMDDAPIPAALSANLRVLASHEHTRRLARVSFSARAKSWRAQARLAFDNMMRPFALPFAGGLLSALVAFGTLVPTIDPPAQATEMIEDRRGLRLRGQRESHLAAAMRGSLPEPAKHDPLDLAALRRTLAPGVDSARTSLPPSA